MGECELCRQGDPAITVRCYNCQASFHLHQGQLDEVQSGSIIIADCPGCGTANCFLKQGRCRVAKAGEVVYPGQTILDLRGKYGVSS